MPDDRSILATGIRRAILSSKLTIADVALRGNWGYSTVHKWTTGQSRPNADNIRRLAYVLDVSQDDLWYGFPEFADSGV